MREIKFRAKRIDNGEWVSGSGLLVSDDFCVIDTDTEMYVDEKYEWAGNTHFFRIAGAMCDLKTIGQYTGLKDKNGKEIYEGDIIRSYDSENKPIIHFIHWHNSNACYVATMPQYPCICSIVTKDWIEEYDKEIIGNIHDNPELIKEEEK